MADLELPFLAIIPHNVLSDKTLQPNAKIYFGCLAGLAKKEGYCYASDAQLAQMFEVTERQIKRWNSTLEEKGYIRRETKNHLNENDSKFLWKRERKIYITEGFSKKVCGSDKNVTIDGDKNVTCINKDIYIKKHTYSKFVKLSENEYDELVKTFGKETVEAKMAKMDAYCSEFRPKGYKNYYLQLKSWCSEKEKKPILRKGFPESKPVLNSQSIEIKLPLYEKFFASNPQMREKITLTENSVVMTTSKGEKIMPINEYTLEYIRVNSVQLFGIKTK